MTVVAFGDYAIPTFADLGPLGGSSEQALEAVIGGAISGSHCGPATTLKPMPPSTSRRTGYRMAQGEVEGAMRAPVVADDVDLAPFVRREQQLLDNGGDEIHGPQCRRGCRHRRARGGHSRAATSASFTRDRTTRLDHVIWRRGEAVRERPEPALRRTRCSRRSLVAGIAEFGELDLEQPVEVLAQALSPDVVRS